MTQTLDDMRLQLAELERRAAGAVSSVRTPEQQVTYRTTDEMIKAMNYLRARIAELECPEASSFRPALARFVCK